MTTNRIRAAAAAAATAATVACGDVPLLPEWDATWYLPVASRSTLLATTFPLVVLPGTSAQDSSLQTQVLDGVIGGLIRDSLREASAVIEAVKTPPVAVAETLFLAASQAALGSAGPGRVELPFAVAAGESARTDTLVVPAAGIAMLHAVAEAEGTLYVMRRGMLSYAGPGNLTLTTTDSIGVRIALLARVAVSR